MSKDSNNTVEVFERLNMLRLKAGIPLDSDSQGYIDPADIKRAQEIIAESEKHYTREIEEVLAKLESSWDDLKTIERKRQKQYIDRIYNYANNAKDLAQTYSYQLMHHFGESLRDFCESLDMKNTAHHTIVQAHINVMWITFKENIEDDGDEKAQELKKVVSIAIEKYS